MVKESESPYTMEVSDDVPLNVVTEPQIYWLAQPQIMTAQLQEFFDDKGINWAERSQRFSSCNPSEILTEIAGRICYMSFDSPRPGNNAEYIKHILEVGHGSVLEHCNLTFLITGVSRTFTHELVRHRAGFAFSQLSQRYVDHSQIRFVMPPFVQDCNDNEIVEEWKNSVLQSLKVYIRASKRLAIIAERLQWESTERRKRIAEAARSALPNCTETAILVTANARSWRHFVEMRAAIPADLEMRRVASKLYDDHQGVFGSLFQDFKLSEDSVGEPFVDGKYKKV